MVYQNDKIPLADAMDCQGSQEWPWLASSARVRHQKSADESTAGHSYSVGAPGPPLDLESQDVFPDLDLGEAMQDFGSNIWNNPVVYGIEIYSNYIVWTWVIKYLLKGTSVPLPKKSSMYGMCSEKWLVILWAAYWYYIPYMEHMGIRWN